MNLKFLIQLLETLIVESLPYVIINCLPLPYETNIFFLHRLEYTPFVNHDKMCVKVRSNMLRAFIIDSKAPSFRSFCATERNEKTKR